jgi:tetratricopeptide (TPR) repeat protein
MRRLTEAVTAAVLLAALAMSASAKGRPVFISDDEWAAVIEAHGVDPAMFRNPLATTSEMEDAAREYAGRGDTPEKLDALQGALFDPAAFTFEYDSDRTLTAMEAFEGRSGNCVSFVNLFIALARTQEIPVRPAILRSVRDTELEGDLLVVNTHLVAAYQGPKQTMVFDFYRSRPDTPVKTRLLDDMALNAIYLNNLGVERLRDDAPEDAARHLEAAVALSPTLAAAYANLGVARRRAGDEQGALDAYFAGLAIAPSHARLLNNLTSLYRVRAIEEGVKPDERPVGLTGVTAEELLARADDDLARGKADRAMQLYKRAHRVDRTLSAPLVGIARMQILDGKLKSARRTLNDALEIDPDDEGARELLIYLDRNSP